ncbi:MAG: hypothetical protein RL328_1059 [Acidobacteriota bacterium]|jgi:hypothetical protein
MAHNPFKQLDFTANERIPEAPKPLSAYPKHVNFPDGSYKVAYDSEEEAAYTAEAEGIAPKKGKIKGLMSKLGL